MKRSLFIALLVALGLGGALGARNTVETCVLGQSCGGGGSGQAVPGLVGSTANDLTVEYLWNLQTFEAMPNWPRFYFSAGAGGKAGIGDDANPCTTDAPCRSLSRAVALLNRQQVIVVLDADTWIDATNDFGGATTFDIANTGCGTGSSSVMTDEPCGFIVPWDPESPATLDCSNFDLTGSPEDAFLDFSGTGSGYYGVAGVTVSHCPRTPISSTANPQTALQGTGGNVVFVNVHVRDYAGMESHAFGVAPGFEDTHFVLVNSGAQSRDPADFDEDCAGATCADSDTVAKALCNTTDDPYPCCTLDSGAGDSQCEGAIHLVELGGQTELTVISDELFWARSTQINAVGPENAQTTAFVFEPPTSDAAHVGDHLLVGPVIRGTRTLTAAAGTGDGFFGIGRKAHEGASGSFTQTLRAARVLFYDFPSNGSLLSNEPAAIRVFNDGIGRPSVTTNVVELFQSTFTTVTNAMYETGQFSSDASRYWMRCSIQDEFDEDAATRAKHFYIGTNAGTITVDIDGTNVYDSDDGTSANTFQMTSNQYTTAATVPANCGCAGGTCSCPGAFFGDGVAANDSGGVGADGDSFTGLDAQAACANGEECDALACGVTVTWPLPTHAFVPTTVVGQKIDTLHLGTEYQRVGAR